jgi:hypothetical protein
MLIALYRDFKDQLGEIARLKDFSQCQVRNNESLGEFSASFLAVIKAPTIFFKIGSSHKRTAFVPMLKLLSLAETIQS